MRVEWWFGGFLVLGAVGSAPAGGVDFFEEEVAPLLERNCLGCHSAEEKKGDVVLDRGPIVVDDPATLLEMVTGAEPEMPKDREALGAAEVEVLRKWVEGGAKMPKGRVLADRYVPGRDWWSLKPVRKPALPEAGAEDLAWCRNEVDRFVIARMREKRLAPSKEADRRTLVRRLFFDLTGLPPAPEKVEAFVGDKRGDAYERLVDELLASPRYGERWARHWLDVARYGETHGYDKDKPRPNAWPYRDYVIRSLNEDKPYGRFVAEQVAGDVLFPGTEEGIVATGFIAAGPWDFIAQFEVGEGKVDGRIAKHMDRDDMVAATFNTFMSTTVQCAQCHNHKFDPVSMEDYYRLHAVFAAVDRAERPYAGLTKGQQAEYDRVQGQRAELTRKRSVLATRMERELAAKTSGIDRRIAEIEQISGTAVEPEFGYHSKIEKTQNVEKWVQVDLGKARGATRVQLIGAHDDYNKIGAGFGFPVRFVVEVANEAEFTRGVRVVRDEREADFPNPGVDTVPVDVGGNAFRYLRVTATKLAPRKNDYIFALAEVRVLSERQENFAAGARVTALDSIESGTRWGTGNLVDGIYYREASNPEAIEELKRLTARRKAIEKAAEDPEEKAELARLVKEIEALKPEVAALPKPPMVYAAATHFAQQGKFTPTNGKPRPIHLLHRGDMTAPREEMRPGAPVFWEGGEAEFRLGKKHSEGERRAKLAKYLTSRKNPLTWRSIVNRVWIHHMGRGIVDSPNDFGRMGMVPTHPELLDWMAAEFRDGGQSLKALHRLIVTSATYRQESAEDEAKAEVDAANRFYWRMPRRKLEAEAVRDAVLVVSGMINEEMYGPSFRDFVIEKPQHSPHYEYHLHDPADPQSHRRSVYRFIVRSQTQPFLTTLDCADPSQMVAKRDETTTPLQALALMNNPFMECMAEAFAERVEAEAADTPARLERAFRLALGRAPEREERDALVKYAQVHGLANACRVIFNLNEFVYVD